MKSQSGKNTYLNSTSVAKRLGVNISTVKRWTDEGKLLCTRTPGGHRRFAEKHITDFIRRFPQFSGVNSTDPDTASFGSYLNFKNESLAPLLQYELKAHAISGNTGLISRLFRFMYRNDIPLAEFFEYCVIPVLRQLGDDWTRNIITIGQEHVATSSIKNAVFELGDLVGDPKYFRPILFSTLKDDNHDIIPTFLSLLARLEGFPVITTGANTPAESLHYYIETYNPGMIFLSYQYGADASLIKKELKMIESFTKDKNTNIYLGGLGVDGLGDMKNSTIIKLESMLTAYSLLKENKTL